MFTQQNRDIAIVRTKKKILENPKKNLHNALGNSPSCRPSSTSGLDHNYRRFSFLFKCPFGSGSLCLFQERRFLWFRSGKHFCVAGNLNEINSGIILMFQLSLFDICKSENARCTFVFSLLIWKSAVWSRLFWFFIFLFYQLDKFSHWSGKQSFPEYWKLFD